MSDTLLTVGDAAEYLRLSKSTVYRKAEIGELPHIKKSFGLRFIRSELAEYLDRDRIKVPLAPSLPHTLAPSVDKSGYYNKEVLIARMAKSSKSKTRYNFGYGAIYQRKYDSGLVRWFIDYRDADGKRIQKVAPLAITKEDATLALRDEVAKTFNRQYGLKQEKEDIGFRVFAELYIRDYAMVRKKSWKSDYYYLHANMIPYFRGTLLSEITQVKIEKYIVKRVGEGIRKSSINRELACLRKLFNKAIDWGYVKGSPMQRIRLFSEKNNLKERVLNYEEENKLFASSSDHLKPIIITGIKTGMRKSEILGLTWSNVDFKKKEIRIENSKSGRVRIIPINVDLLRELERVKMKNGKYDWVFVNPNTGRPFTDVKKAFQGACIRAGIKGLRFHDLRHTFASRLVERGVDIITVKDLLGHGSVKVTERYTHSNQHLKKAAVDVLSRNQEKGAKNEQYLLPICDMKTKSSKESPVKTSFSIN